MCCQGPVCVFHIHPTCGLLSIIFVNIANYRSDRLSLHFNWRRADIDAFRLLKWEWTSSDSVMYRATNVTHSGGVLSLIRKESLSTSDEYLEKIKHMIEKFRHEPPQLTGLQGQFFNNYILCNHKICSRLPRKKWASMINDQIFKITHKNGSGDFFNNALGMLKKEM